ncbi:DUF4145 domain-containing protein [Streptomyces sp. NPDC002588]|uniref:DUF4145 domain-containing protein n=1 Tax=Streptomyces sp. NPDC002588 TaxID=3154419 RepID=UPI00332C12AB
MASSNVFAEQLKIQSLGQRRAFCPHQECAVGVAMTLRDRRTVHPHVSGNLGVTSTGLFVCEELWTCDLCSRAIVELVGYEGLTPGGSVADADASEERWRRQLWPEPAPRELSPDAPEMVRTLYAEASRAENAHGFRLAGVGYRAVVEEICKDQGATAYNLHGKIKELADRGLPQDVVDAMHEARVVGNDSVHHNVEYAADEIADLAEIIAEAVEILYVEPAKRKRMAAARKARSDAAKAPRP